MKKTQTIFKFVSVRPAETTTKATDPSCFINFENLLPAASAFQKELEKADDAKKKDQSAKLLKGSSLSGNTLLKKMEEAWLEINQLAGSYRKETILTDGDRKKLSAQLAALLKTANTTFIESIWDLLVASVNDSATLPFDRAKLIHPIRVINLAKNADRALSDVNTLKQFLKATPVIKKQHVRKAAANPGKASASAGVTVDTALAKVNSIQKALDELVIKKREFKRGLSEINRQAVKKSASVRAPAATKVSVAEISENTVRHTGSPFVFSETVSKTISKDTGNLIKELGFSLSDRISTIIAGVEKEQQKAVVAANLGKGVRNLFSGKSKASTVAFMGNVTAPSKAPAITAAVPSGKGSVKPIGIGDLLLVEEELIRYSMHEISNVENIMKSEYKERVHRVMEQKEETYLFESETTSETEEDLQKAERYELQKESESVIQSQQDASAGVSVSASYGPVSANVSASYSISNSQEESVSSSTSYAKEITEQSVTKIIQRTLEQSSSKTLTEVEETNTHGFDNKAGTGHVIGIYRYLNKVYRAQVYNYGKRLFFEFMVPEPAAFYKYALTNQSLPGMTLSMPDDEILTLSPTDITRTTYPDLVRLYQAQGVTPPPVETQYVAKAFYMDFTKGVEYSGLADGEMQVPDGYYAESFNLERAYGVENSDKAAFIVVVGDRYSNLREGEVVGDNLSRLTGTVPVVVKTSFLTNWGVTVEIECTITDEKFEEWQITTYGALLDAYNSLKSAYEEELASSQSEAGIGEYGQSDDMNRVIEKTELKRGCITLLTDQNFELFNAMDYSGEYPEIDVSEAMAEGKYVQFFEQAFEWDNVTYLFFPYFWGQKTKWTENINIQNSDTKFQDFLQAGFARVVIPVRPGYDSAILHYLETGQIWEGGDTPVIDDELYVSIIEELYDLEGEEEKTVVGDPWELTVPTSLVYLQTESTLPDLEAEAAAAE